MPGYRVFISYSHHNEKEFHIVRDAVERLGLQPWSDRNLHVGNQFSNDIQTRIAHSHIFLPILTPEAHANGWVHQEIGFAMAMHVPFVPLCFGALPSGMIQMSHAIVVQDLGECVEKLRREDFDRLVAEAGRRWSPVTDCAYEPGERADLIRENALDAMDFLKGAGCVRHAGGLSSFRIPKDKPDEDVWATHYGRVPRGPEIYWKLHGEREALEKHARGAGCKLIIQWLVDLDRAYGKGAGRARLTTLVEFLENLTDEQAEVALVDPTTPHSLLIVGNWFLAESAAVLAGRGIRHTFFVPHAPSIDRRIAEFDHDLDVILRKQKISPGQSRRVAIRKLKALITKLPKGPRRPTRPTKPRRTRG